MNDIPDSEQIGPYRVVRYIDRGAFAWVFEVQDPKFAGRRLALKMLMPEAAEGEEFRRFESEARLLAQIDHPSVVTIFDWGRDEATGNFYYVMTYVDGATLKERLKQGPMSSAEALSIFIDLLDGLARLHEKGIVHRDIKPANVLLGREGRARLADLGIARVQDERGQTRTGVAVGTALYMSPEQARGREVDPRSDLFSVGLTLYECLTGNVVYDHVDSVDSSSGMDVLMYIGSLVHTQSEFDVRFDSDSDVSPEIQGVINHALRLNAEDRFASAEEMRQALIEAQSGGHALPPHHLPPVTKWVSIGAGVIGALLIALGAYFFVIVPQREAEEQRVLATQAFKELSALSELAIAVTSAAHDLDPALSAELLERVDDRVDRADRYLEDGETDLVGGGHALALTNLRRGTAQYVAACQFLVDEVLTARAEAGVSALRERAIALSDAEAQEVVPDVWKALAAVLPASDAAMVAGGGCPAAEQLLARLGAVAAGGPLADDVAASLAKRWPELANEAYEKAVTEKQVAVAVPAGAREYKVALREAKRLLLKGTRAKNGGDFRNAREAYESARKGFLVAAAIAPAALSRDEANTLLEQVASESGDELAGAAELVTRGEKAYTDEDWKQSEALFKEATAELKELRAANAWRRAAIQVKRESEARRDEAVKAGAGKSAPTEFAQAEVFMSDAERALDAGDAKEAELGFASARDEYSGAQKRAIQSLRDASMKRTSVAGEGEKLLQEGECADLPDDGARTHCLQAAASLTRGTEALDQMDAPGALRNFYAALESYARARSALVLWEATRPRPPVLVRRVPQRPVVKVSSRQLHNFGVEASDPNGDLLSYTWTIDGVVQREKGPTMKRRLEQSAQVAVKVDDGKGGELEETWRVDVVERTPAPGES